MGISSIGMNIQWVNPDNEAPGEAIKKYSQDLNLCGMFLLTSSSYVMTIKRNEHENRGNGDVRGNAGF